ncbi:MAG: tRNA lysidine(34) synthetase TilS [Alphaproteobacteria bacterium]
MLLKKFTDFISHQNIQSPSKQHFVVAVSGGADSLALALVTNAFCKAKGHKLTTLTVDHNLREDASIEAEKVKNWLAAQNIEHKTLLWAHPENKKPTGNIQALARAARYELLENFCTENNVAALLLGHHQEDQAETFMLRLARGSGVYGLAAMQEAVTKDWGKILRPFLSISREDLKTYLHAQGQEWIEDPSNTDERYARVRMRNLMPTLSAEGLTTERLIKTAKRMDEAKKVMQQLVETLYQDHSTQAEEAKGISFSKEALTLYPEEISLRFLARCLRTVGGKSYTPRLDSLERVLSDLLDFENFKGCTLANCKITKKAQNIIFIQPENF